MCISTDLKWLRDLLTVHILSALSPDACLPVNPVSTAIVHNKKRISAALRCML